MKLKLKMDTKMRMKTKKRKNGKRKQKFEEIQKKGKIKNKTEKWKNPTFLAIKSASTKRENANNELQRHQINKYSQN